MASSMNLAAEAGAAAAAAADVQYAARIIIDTDYAFRKQFSSNGKANDYIADLIAYASIPYKNEVKTELLIQDIRLATNGNDPYKNKTDCSDHLDKVRKEWSGKSTQRALVHLISGKKIGTSCAWTDTLCSKSLGYSVSTDIGNDFNINNVKPMWEGVVIAHEIGHNFGSTHTHKYCGIEGIAKPVDVCVDSASYGYSNCFGDHNSNLPGIGKLDGGTEGAGAGTLMSYCDQQDGGYANISHTFGKNHKYGVAAYRVPNVMLGKVVEHASCMAFPLPDFVTPQIKMFDLSGTERYTYKINEAGTVTAWIDNTGDANWEEGNTKDKIKVSFFLSKGENVDEDSKWVRLSQQDIQKANLRIEKNAKQESFTFDLAQLANSGYIAAGKYNFVACADYPRTENNGIGDVREKSESNNCSKEAVFTVEPLVYPDLAAHSLQLNSGGTTLNGGSLYGLTVNVQNIGTGSVGSRFQIKYEIKGPETGGAWKLVAEKTFNPVPLAPGADKQYNTGNDLAIAPAEEGDYTLRACMDSRMTVEESNEGNNCTEFAVHVPPSSVSLIKPVYRFWSDLLSAHFYTISKEERDYVIATYPPETWRYEKIAYYAYPSQEDDALPVYRFWSDLNGNHLYTISEDEKNRIIATYPPETWRYEKIVWYAYTYQKEETVPVYRFWSDRNQVSFYTASEEEKAHVIATYPQDVWRYEDIAWYAFNAPLIPQPVYRFWSDKNGAHFYTASEEERDRVILTYPPETWRYERVAWCADVSQKDDSLPVYRFWSDKYSSHFYTISEDEKNRIISTYPPEVWKYEKIAWYAYTFQKSGTIPVYRFWNDRTQTYFYTSSEEEKNYVIANYPSTVWRYDGIAWYGFQCP
jgi:hypothetical protein